MKITLVSDLHLEFSDINLTNEQGADVLILGGDIMMAENLHEFPANDPMLPISFTNRDKARRFREFLKRVTDTFPNIIYIAGNHEFYHGNFPAAIDWLREECDAYSNLYFLEMDLKQIDDVVFVGATLWTDMNKGDPSTVFACQNNMNDYRVIRNNLKNYAKLRPSDTVKRHKETLKFLNDTIQDPNKKYIVVGHHAPSKLSVKPRYEKDYLLNGAYSSDLSEFILDHPEIKLWTHGHTHDTFDYMIGSTRIVCNPRGYEGYEPDSGWDPNMVLEI